MMNVRRYRLAIVRALALTLAAFVVSSLLGCGRAPVNIVKPNGPAQNEDALELARDMIRKATEVALYREALDQVSTFLIDHPDKLNDSRVTAKDRPRLHKLLGPAEKLDGVDERTLWRKVLQTRWQLFDDEIEAVESNRFTPLDAHHVAFCYQLRDVLHTLQLHGRTPLQQAELCFGWVMRQVALRDSESELLPPQFVLRRGYGSARERALVFLALLEQAEKLDGCMVALPDDAAPEGYRYWLPGVLIHDKDGPNIYLFDTRLGIPLPGPDGKGVAALADVQKHPKLLDQLHLDNGFKYDVESAQARSAEIHLGCPVAALSPRMHFLQEEVLGVHDRIRLATSPLDVLERFESAKVGTVGVWNRRGDDAKQPPVSPVRALRLALPPREGGIDSSNKFARLIQQTIPLPTILFNLQQMKLRDLPAEAQDRLFNSVCAEIFQRFVLTPRHQMLHGRLEEAHKPVERILSVIDEFARKIHDSQEARKTVADWRLRVKQAHQDWKEEGKIADWDKLWAEDQWLIELIAAGDDAAKKQEEPPKRQLSYVTFQLVSEPLGKDALFLRAQNWHEKAQRLQARLERQAGNKTLAEDVAGAWSNAQDAWQRFLFRSPFAAGDVRNRVQTIRHLLVPNEAISQPESRGLALTLVGQFFHDVRRMSTARLLQAHAADRAGDRRTAIRLLDQLTLDLDGVRKSTELEELRKELLAGPANAALQAEVEHLYRDLAPTGSLHWLRYTAQLRKRRLADT